MKNMGVKELKKQLDSGKEIHILDVREEIELQYGKIEGSHWIPISEVESRITEIPKDKDLVVYCRSGGRSGSVISFLEEKGYKNATNLTGGIIDWARFIDDSIEMY
jgi:sulfur-carrier protein adenylyltransferase/sulfurtransferase